MAEIDSIRSCGECKFFVDVGHIGECRRYPKIEQKFSLHYCGEFLIKHTVVISTPMVVDIAPEVKKRGRPAGIYK